MKLKDVINNKKLKYAIVLILVLIEISSLFLMSKTLLNKDNSIDEKKHQYPNNNMFAILLEQDDGKYVESTDSTWPTNYTYNASMSGCINENGQVIKGALEFDTVTNKAKITTNETAYCYLYFDKGLIGEAYALLTQNGKYYDLTFVRSETPIVAGSLYNGAKITEVYTGIEEESFAVSIPPWYEYASVITNVVFEDEIRPVSTVYWFAEMQSLENINLNNLNTLNVTDMDSMFDFTTINTVLDLSGWDTSNVTDMSYMFHGATINTNLDLSGWDTSNVTDMSYMFSSTKINTDLDLSGWDTSNVTNMSSMFEGATINTDLDLSEWDTSNVTNMSLMFGYTSINTDLDLSGWDVSNVTDMSYIFSETTINTDLDLSNWNVVNAVYYFGFNDVDGSGTLTPPVWQNVYFGVYSETDYSLRIYSNIGSIDIPTVGKTYNGKKVTKIYNMSEGSSPVSCSTTIVPTSIIAEDNIIAPSNTSSWFSGCTKVNNINLSKLDTSNVMYMSSMFKNVGSDTSVTSMTITGLDSWDTSKVLNMNSMFYNFGLKATYRLDLSGWDVSKIIANSYKDFNYGVTTKVIAPTWNTTT